MVDFQHYPLWASKVSGQGRELSTLTSLGVVFVFHGVESIKVRRLPRFNKKPQLKDPGVGELQYLNLGGNCATLILVTSITATNPQVLESVFNTSPLYAAVVIFFVFEVSQIVTRYTAFEPKKLDSHFFHGYAIRGIDIWKRVTWRNVGGIIERFTFSESPNVIYALNHSIVGRSDNCGV